MSLALVRLAVLGEQRHVVTRPQPLQQLAAECRCAISWSLPCTTLLRNPSYDLPFTAESPVGVTLMLLVRPGRSRTFTAMATLLGPRPPPPPPPPPRATRAAALPRAREAPRVEGIGRSAAIS